MGKERDRYVEFGRRLGRLRLERGLSQEKLAELAGLDVSYIGRAEAGRRNPTLKTIGRLADALGVEDYELISDVKPADGTEAPDGDS